MDVVSFDCRTKDCDKIVSWVPTDDPIVVQVVPVAADVDPDPDAGKAALPKAADTFVAALTCTDWHTHLYSVQIDG